jgi:hypothetical protein
MKMDATAFRLMADNLYSDKILAVVREYTTNAIDSHIEAGNDAPVRVHFPTSIEPWFAVEDDGIGLDHDDAMVLYSTYFESTKRDTNEQTGCFGLGSKSAFAYVDAFTVTCRFNGMLRVYSCVLDAGIPSISLLSESKTDRPNGVEVKIPVAQRSDFVYFVEAGQRIFPWAKRPVQTNNASNSFAKPTATASGNDWAYYPASSIRSNITYGVFVNYAGVLYEVPMETTARNNATWDVFALFHATSRLVVDIPASACLSVQTSREALSYDNQTKAAVYASIHQALRQAKAKVQADIDAKPSFNEAFRYVSALSLLGSRLFSYKGVPLSSSIVTFAGLDALCYESKTVRKKFGSRQLIKSISNRQLLVEYKIACIIDESISLERVKASFPSADVLVKFPDVPVTEKKVHARAWATFFRDWCDIETVFSSSVAHPKVATIRAALSPEGARIYRYNNDEHRLAARPQRCPLSTFNSDTIVMPRSAVSEKMQVTVVRRGVPVKFGWKLFGDMFGQAVVVHDDDLAMLPKHVSFAYAFDTFLTELQSKHFKSECIYASKPYLNESTFKFLKNTMERQDFKRALDGLGTRNGHHRIIAQMHNEKLLVPLTGMDLDPIAQTIDSIYEEYPLLVDAPRYGTDNSAYKEYVRAIDLLRSK